jgi:hypothetical protein
MHHRAADFGVQAASPTHGIARQPSGWHLPAVHITHRSTYMLKKTKLAVALVVALAAMGVAASSAFAIEAAISRGGAVNATSASVSFEGSGVTIVCPLTMALSLRTASRVVVNEQIGEVTGVTIGACEGGRVSGVLGTPWRITVNSTLPAIETLTTRNARGVLLNIVNAAFNLSIFGGFVNCLYRGNAGGLMPLTATAREEVRYTASTIDALAGINIPLFEGGFGCPANGHFAGRFTLAATQTVTLS